MAERPGGAGGPAAAGGKFAGSLVLHAGEVFEAAIDGETAAKSVPVSAGDDPIIERDGFNTFRVHGKDASKGALVFHRYGLRWKLAGVDLPHSSDG